MGIDVVVSAWIVIYGACNITSKKSILEKIEGWLYLLAFIGMNILFRMM